MKTNFESSLKLSRNSQETYIDEKNKQRYIKLKEAKFAHRKSFPIEKLMLKGKVYQQASCLIEYDNCIIKNKTYKVVKVTLKTRLGQNLFKEPIDD